MQAYRWQTMFSLLAVLTLNLCAYSCSSSEESQPLDTSSTVGPSGGTIEDETGARLEVPAGALEGETTFFIEAAPSGPSPEEGLSAVTALFKVGPEGTAFAKPARLYLPIEPGSLPSGYDAETVWVFRAVGPDKWEPIPTEVEGDFLVAEIDHLSFYWGLFGCRSNGNGCEYYAHCCTSACVDNVCTNCLAEGAACTGSNQCCGDNYCGDGGKCTPCVEFGNACPDGYGCCDGLDVSCLNGQCSDCLSSGEPCESATQCCYGFLFVHPCCVDGKCSLDCGELGQGCNRFDDCCGWMETGASQTKCYQDKCSACGQIGQPCEGTSCCDGAWCKDDKCVGCLKNGEECALDQYCCSDICIHGRCQKCEPTGPCDEKTSCCIDECDYFHFCPKCPEPESDCSKNGDCCPGDCCTVQHQECVGTKCVPCAAKGTACNDNNECCDTNICFGGTCTDCREIDDTCETEPPSQKSDCCVGAAICLENICVECGELDDTCGADTPCCQHPCIMDKCQPCLSNGKVCIEPGDCCEKSCVMEVCQKCVDQGAKCKKNTDCCQFSCKLGKCQPCIAENQMCSEDSDCCEGRCHLGTCQGCHDDDTEDQCGAFPNECCAEHQCVDGACEECVAPHQICVTEGDDEKPCCDGGSCWLPDDAPPGATIGICRFLCTKASDCPDVCSEDKAFALLWECEDGLCKPDGSDHCKARGQTCVQGKCLGECHQDTVDSDCPAKCANDGSEYIDTATCVDGACTYNLTKDCGWSGKICHNNQCVDGCALNNPGGGCPPECGGEGNQHALEFSCIDGVCQQVKSTDCVIEEGTICSAGQCLPGCTEATAAEDCPAQCPEGSNELQIYKCENGACQWANYHDCELDDKICVESECVSPCGPDSGREECPGSCLLSDAIGIEGSCTNGLCAFADPDDCSAFSAKCVDGQCLKHCTQETALEDCPGKCKDGAVWQGTCEDDMCKYVEAVNCTNLGKVCFQGFCESCPGLDDNCGSDYPACCKDEPLECVDGKCISALPKTYSDTGSGLMWEAKLGIDEPVDLAEGQAYCSGLELDSFGGWRVPTISELRSLVRGCADTGAGGACPITDSNTQWPGPIAPCSCVYDEGPGNSNCYWPNEIQDEDCDDRRFISTTPMTGEFVDPNTNYTLSFSTATIHYYWINTTSDAGHARVRCVRNM